MLTLSLARLRGYAASAFSLRMLFCLPFAPG